jgi:hypothetical protein
MMREESRVGAIRFVDRSLDAFFRSPTCLLVDDLPDPPPRPAW